MLPFLVPLLPHDVAVPPLGAQVRWPGDDLLYVWTGHEWRAIRDQFDGGDSWLELEGYEDAA